METKKEILGMGWIPDLPDYRDYSPNHEKIMPLLADIKMDEPEKRTLPPSHDLRQWCSEVEHQGHLNSCTAQAGAGLIEYYENKAFGHYIDASRLFLYKATRNLLNWTGDTGAYLRTTMGAMVLFGAPPEKYWPYTDSKQPGPSGKPPFEEEPPAFHYSFAQSYRSIAYFRLDPPGTPLATLLHRYKVYLAAGLPFMFGFTVFISIRQAGSTGKIPFPCPRENVEGGHAVVAVGYDDGIKTTNSICGKETKGALLIRNSWGPRWGESGYGWLPYEYVLSGMARDAWVLFKKEYVNTKQFGF